MRIHNPVVRGLATVAMAAATLGLSSGAASASASQAASASARPANCSNAVSPDGNGREVYTYTGRLVTPSGSLFEYLGDAGDYFYSDVFMGDSFVRFCI